LSLRRKKKAFRYCFILQKKYMKYLLIFFTITFNGQVLHHQTLSSQGISEKMTNGIMVNQSIGQLSVSGNFINDKTIVGQGFQQNNISKLKISSTTNSSITYTYPNPFIDRLNFNFNKLIDGKIKILIFDMLGRLIYNQEKIAVQNILTIENLHFAAGEYFVRLTAKDYNYSTKILKIK
jgi:hydroxymethylpyrimidine pyrophosphatase-like HAD family hydrolase